MNVFCRLFGHTWLADIRVPEVRWNTTKEGHTLVSTIGEEEIRHLEVCRRCGEERPVAARRHDADRPADAAPPSDAAAEPSGKTGETEDAAEDAAREAG